MNSRKIIIIKKWTELKSFYNIQMFIKFINFYYYFIRGFFVITALIINLLKSMKKDKKKRFFK